MAEAGLSPDKIIRTATRDAAEHLGLLGKLGTVEPGKIADLILVDGDPLNDIGAMNNIQVVIQSGKVVYDREAEKIKAVENNSDEFNPVGSFIVPVSDVKRAVKFYEHVLDVSLQYIDIGPVEIALFPSYPNAKGVSGIIFKTEDHKPVQEGGITIFFFTQDLDVALQRVKDKGSKILAPKFSIDGKTSMAIITDFTSIP